MGPWVARGGSTHRGGDKEGEKIACGLDLKGGRIHKREGKIKGGI